MYEKLKEFLESERGHEAKEFLMTWIMFFFIVGFVGGVALLVIYLIASFWKVSLVLVFLVSVTVAATSFHREDYPHRKR